MSRYCFLSLLSFLWLRFHEIYVFEVIDGVGQIDIFLHRTGIILSIYPRDVVGLSQPFFAGDERMQVIEDGYLLFMLSHVLQVGQVNMVKLAHLLQFLVVEVLLYAAYPPLLYPLETKHQTSELLGDVREVYSMGGVRSNQIGLREVAFDETIAFSQQPFQFIHADSEVIDILVHHIQLHAFVHQGRVHVFPNSSTLVPAVLYLNETITHTYVSGHFLGAC